jgi:hypothetical protein
MPPRTSPFGKKREAMHFVKGTLHNHPNLVVGMSAVTFYYLRRARSSI